jgi:hypothetical protein
MLKVDRQQGMEKDKEGKGREDGSQEMEAEIEKEGMCLLATILCPLLR